MADGIEQFPYLVVRFIPAVYCRFPIHFVPNDQVRPDGKALTLVEPRPFDADGKLTPGCLEKLIVAVKHGAKGTGLRMCLVLGPKEAIYAEPNGELLEKLDPPSGGVDLRAAVGD